MHIDIDQGDIRSETPLDGWTRGSGRDDGYPVSGSGSRHVFLLHGVVTWPAIVGPELGFAKQACSAFAGTREAW